MTLVQTLGLAPHPEGGFYKETFRSTMSIETARGPRSASTAILFLLEAQGFSAFHKVFGDELWHFYGGSAMELHTLDAQGHQVRILSAASPQLVVKDGVWQASFGRGPEHTLVGCTVAPGFEFRDFVMAKRSELVREFPRESAVIERFTRA